MDYIARHTTPIGNLLMSSNGEALTGLWFYGQKYFADTLDSIHEEYDGLPVFHDTHRWLDIYFSGKKPDFTPPLLMRTSEFRKKVWKTLLTIPYGQTTTYGEIASVIGCRSAQAVGGAIGHNAISLIIPCHRVISTDGNLTGYAGGIERKAYLLNLEKNLR
ncbi:MAG: methylated-DNA--[protein]-cysteine S-methyltransferase [Bacteroidales bacterium]|nr:methylated-DNA--[protein]-cysteine S-methyltransferase [Bacteroidales bacterium]